MIPYRDVVQGTPEWLELRRGRPTASEFSQIITPAKAQLSTSMDSYICSLIAERYFVGDIDDLTDIQTQAMKNGTALEPRARQAYEFDNDCEIEQVGFVTTDDGRAGCSPDGLWKGERRGLELKCPTGKTHLLWRYENVLPNEHKCQVHGCMAVTGYPAWDFCSFVPGLPMFTVRVKWDAFTDALCAALDVFHSRYDEILERLDLGEPTRAQHEPIDLPACMAL